MTAVRTGPTGRQFHIESTTGAITAQVAELGAALRALTVGGVDLVPRYSDDIPTPAASGIVLAPWPNRVRDGRWTQRGTPHQLAITETSYGNASHGLLRFAPYRLAHEDAASVTLEATIFPQTGYPYLLHTAVTYSVSGTGLTVTHRIGNGGTDAAPVALGTHPYLHVGDVPTSDLTIELDAPTRFALDDRMLPVAEVPVDAATDLRTPRRLGDLSLDTAYSGLTRGADDRIRAVLRAPDGRAVELWAGTGFEYLQVFTTDRYPGQELAVAIEPMTAPADALNSGRHLRWLDPGEQWVMSWGIIPHLG